MLEPIGIKYIAIYLLHNTYTQMTGKICVQLLWQPLIFLITVLMFLLTINVLMLQSFIWP